MLPRRSRPFSSDRHATDGPADWNEGCTCALRVRMAPGTSRHVGSVVFTNVIARYLLAFVAVASALAAQIWLISLTGTGAPFVLLFAALLVTLLFAGVGPGICALALSAPLTYMFMTRGG